MFHLYFLGSSEGLLFDVPREPFPQALWEPLAARLTALGAAIRTGTPVEAVRHRPGGGLAVRTPDGERPCDGLVLALDVHGLRQVADASPELGDDAWRHQVAALRTAPPFLVSRLWLDRPVAPGRPGFLGTSGYGRLDNISVLERWEGEAARWARRTGGSVVELHGYAMPPGADRAAEQARLLGELHRVYPETRDAAVLDSHHEWRADCPLFPVGGWPGRPAVATPDPRVVLAGDAVRTPFPTALMERAATTGFLAANALLARWGVAGETLWSVPTRGRSAALRLLAALAD
jgi:isorenieratene synthase